MFKNVFCLTHQKMLDDQYFWTWPNSQRFSLTSKFQMFIKKCLIIWPGPYEHQNALDKFRTKNENNRIFEVEVIRSIERNVLNWRQSYKIRIKST